MRLARFIVAAAVLSCPIAAQLPIEQPIVFVEQVPVEYTFATIASTFGNFQGYYPPEDQPVGGNLFRLDPDGTVTPLTSWSNAAVRDPEISPDGTRVLFSMKIGAMGHWQIWEAAVDGTELARISRDDAHHDLDPAYLPDGRIVFTTDRLRWSDGYENLPSAQLAVMDGDGRGVEVVKRNAAGHFNPLLGADGMLYLTQWDFHDRRTQIVQNTGDLDVNRFLLWKVFADGTGLDHPHFGAHTYYDFDGGYVEVRELPDAPGTYVATLADEFFTFGGGALVRLEPHANQNLDEPVFLTPDVFLSGDQNPYGRWRSPYPLANGGLVAAYSPGPVYEDEEPPPHWELVVMNGDGGGQQTLYRHPDRWLWQPVEVVARPLPDLAPGAGRPGFPYALLNALDVTNRGRNGDDVMNGDYQPAIEPGEATTVRFFREDLRTPNYYDEFPEHADPDVELLGSAPVAPDGSFAVAVPTDVPLTWEVLDESGGLLVRERFGTELRAGEIRTCNGCHSPHDGTLGATTNLALASPTNLSGVDVDLDDDGIIDLLEPLECIPGGGALCLAEGRFRVEVAWRDFAGGTGVGTAVPLTGDTGAFWFFAPQNLELMVKVLDGRPVNGHFWVFYGALSNVEYTLRVTDTETGLVVDYENELGAFGSRGDTNAFPDAGRSLPTLQSAHAERGSSCAPGALCLLDQRFRVEVEWTDFSGGSGSGTPEPLTADTGAFWFFAPQNLELMVKVLDGRPVNGHFWVFSGALSNVGYTIEVTDTETGTVVRYENPSGTFGSRGDTTAFGAGPP